jgi:hypothetical protein
MKPSSRAKQKKTFIQSAGQAFAIEAVKNSSG